uniref:Solute carrier family 3 member 2 N-terminal domain-containing protein n=1 Tax=Salarias fasciatus TaxID=181472 RepID=A0A672INC0_SALFA
MPLNAGDAEYGSMSGNGLAGNVDSSETAPLLMPEPDREPVQPWAPLSKGELQAVAGGPGWRKARCYLVLLFWLSWLAILSTAVAIIIYSPRPVVPQLQWWQRAPFFQVEPQLLLQADRLQLNFSGKRHLYSAEVQRRSYTALPS